MNTFIVTILIIFEIFLALLTISIISIYKQLNKQFICSKCNHKHKVLPKKCENCKSKMEQPTFYKTILFGKRNYLDKETELLSSRNMNFWIVFDIVLAITAIIIVAVILIQII